MGLEFGNVNVNFVREQLIRRLREVIVEERRDVDRACCCNYGWPVMLDGRVSFASSSG